MGQKQFIILSLVNVKKCLNFFAVAREKKCVGVIDYGNVQKNVNSHTNIHIFDHTR